MQCFDINYYIYIYLFENSEEKRKRKEKKRNFDHQALCLSTKLSLLSFKTANYDKEQIWKERIKEATRNITKINNKNGKFQKNFIHLWNYYML